MLGERTKERLYVARELVPPEAMAVRDLDFGQRTPGFSTAPFEHRMGLARFWELATPIVAEMILDSLEEAKTGLLDPDYAYHAEGWEPGPIAPQIRLRPALAERTILELLRGEVLAAVFDAPAPPILYIANDLKALEWREREVILRGEALLVRRAG